MAEKQILIVCGEASGDLHAGALAKRILQVNPDIRILGVGGENLRRYSAKLCYDIKGLSVLGFFEVLKKLPQFLRLKRTILEIIQKERPSAIILVDFSGFNLRLAKAIKNSITTIYYISPQVWASRQGRIKTIKKYISKMIVFFKFEEEFYKKYGVNAEFVGHPLLDIVSPSMDKAKFSSENGLDSSKLTIALLPGSRLQEINNIFPIMLRTAMLIKNQSKDAQFIVAKSSQVDLSNYQRLAHGFSPDLKIVEGKTYDCLNIADFCLVASGTATLEAAIMEKPFAIIYKMDLLNYLLYRPQVRIPYIGMVNIVAGKRVIPEFVQFQAKPEKIAAAVLDILSNPLKLREMTAGLSQVKSKLGGHEACLRAAQIVNRVIIG